MTRIQTAPPLIRKEWPEVLKPERSRCTDIIGLKSLDPSEPWVFMKRTADELQNKPDFSKAP